VLIEAEQASHYKMAILAYLKRLARRRTEAHAQIDLISTSYGRTVWSGTPLELRRHPARAQDLVEKTRSEPTRCNNLPGAFDELKRNLAALERQGTSEIHVLIFSSLVHTPRPCADLKTLALPQLPPENSDINGALTASEGVRSISIFWVSPHRRRVYEEHFAKTFAWADANSVHFDLFDEVRTKNKLREGFAPLEVRR